MQATRAITRRQNTRYRRCGGVVLGAVNASLSGFSSTSELTDRAAGERRHQRKASNDKVFHGRTLCRALPKQLKTYTPGDMRNLEFETIGGLQEQKHHTTTHKS